jgi:hypothetical protein
MANSYLYTSTSTASESFDLGSLTAASDVSLLTLTVGSDIGVPGVITMGTLGQVLTVVQNGPNLDIQWTTLSGTGTVTSVAASSSSGLTIGGSPITSSGTITIDLPTGTAGQVLAINTTGPQTLHWIAATSGTVTSVGISSSTGLTIGSSPVTGSGTITVDLPSGGSAGQVLAVNTTGPQTLHWITPSSSSGTVTSVAVTSANTAIGITGSPITGSGTIQLTNQWWNVAAGSPISIGNFAINNCSSYQLVQNISPPSPPDNGGVISFNGTTGLFADLNDGTTVKNYNIVLSATPNYGLSGSLLVGNGTQYSPLPVGTDGQVLQVSNTGTVVWQDASVSGITEIANTDNAIGISSPMGPTVTLSNLWWQVNAGGGVNLNGNSLDGVYGLFLDGLADIPGPGGNQAMIGYLATGEGQLICNVDVSSVQTNYNIPLSTTGNYGATGSLLVGNSSGNYTPLPISTQAGHILASNGTTAEWVAPSAPLGAGQIALSINTPNAPLWGNNDYIFIEDSNVNLSTTLVNAWGQGTPGSAFYPVPAQGPITVYLTANGPDPVAGGGQLGYFLVNALNQTGSFAPAVGYQVVQY